MFQNVYTKFSPLADHAFFDLIFQIQKYDNNLTWLIYIYVHKNDIS